MHKNDLIKIRNEIGSIPVMEGDFASDDNVSIALSTYFEGLPECPDDDVDDEIGWSQWAVDKTNNVLERIIDKLYASATKQPAPPTIEMKEKERFEKWAESKEMDIEAYSYNPKYIDEYDYADIQTQMMWECWKEASQQPDEQPQNFTPSELARRIKRTGEKILL